MTGIAAFARVGIAAALACASGLAAQSPSLDSLETYRRLVATATQARDSARLADAHRALALVHWQDDRYDSALVHLLQAESIQEARRDTVQLGRIYNTLGATHYQAGNYEPALANFLRSLSIRRAIGDRRGEAVNLTNIGKTYHDWGQYERALSVLREAVAAAERTDDGIVRGYGLHALGVVYLDMGSADSARALLQRSWQAYLSHQPRLTPADSSSAWSFVSLPLARLDVRQGNTEAALTRLRAVLTAAERGGTFRGRIEAQLGLGAAYLAAGRVAEARSAFTAAARLGRDINQRPLTVEALAGLAQSYEASGDARAALRTLREHNALRDSIFDRRIAQRIAGMELEAQAERQRREYGALVEQDRTQRAVIARQRIIVVLAAALVLLGGVLALVLWRFNRQGVERERLLAATNGELRQANQDLTAAMAEVRTLSGFIPICAHCKRVRDDQGYWNAVEHYISSHTEAVFSHAICSTCGPELYGADWEPSVSAPEPSDRPASQTSETHVQERESRRSAGFTMVELLVVIIVLGVLAAIAISKFAGSKERAYVVTMRGDLRNLVTAQTAYQSDRDPPMFAASLADLGAAFRGSAGVTLTLGDAGDSTWSAVATHAGTTRRCAIYVGLDPVAPATLRGQVGCD